MSPRVETLTANLKKRPGASEEALRALERNCKGRIPVAYLEFLRTSNGAEGCIGGGYIQLWSAENILIFNENYQVAEFAPGLLLFASDGGGTGYGFDCRTDDASPIVDVTFVGLSFDEAIHCADTFEGFLEFVSNQR